MSKKSVAPPRPRAQRAADGYARFLLNWAWLLPAGVGVLGLSSAITTQVFLPLWGGIAVFAALGMLALVLVGKIRIRAGWIVAGVLTPFIGQVGLMSYTLLLLAAAAYTALFVPYVVLLVLAKRTRRKPRPAGVVNA